MAVRGRRGAVRRRCRVTCRRCGGGQPPRRGLRPVPSDLPPVPLLLPCRPRQARRRSVPAPARPRPEPSAFLAGEEIRTPPRRTRRRPCGGEVRRCVTSRRTRPPGFCRALGRSNPCAPRLRHRSPGEAAPSCAPPPSPSQPPGRGGIARHVHNGSVRGHAGASLATQSAPDSPGSLLLAATMPGFTSAAPAQVLALAQPAMVRQRPHVPSGVPTPPAALGLPVRPGGSPTHRPAATQAAGSHGGVARVGVSRPRLRGASGRASGAHRARAPGASGPRLPGASGPCLCPACC